jgi:hypothetical protein
MQIKANWTGIKNIIKFIENKKLSQYAHTKLLFSTGLDLYLFFCMQKIAIL